MQLRRNKPATSALLAQALRWMGEVEADMGRQQRALSWYRQSFDQVATAETYQLAMQAAIDMDVSDPWSFMDRCGISSREARSIPERFENPAHLVSLARGWIQKDEPAEAATLYRRAIDSARLMRDRVDITTEYVHKAVFPNEHGPAQGLRIYAKLLPRTTGNSRLTLLETIQRDAIRAENFRVAFQTLQARKAALQSAGATYDADALRRQFKDIERLQQLWLKWQHSGEECGCPKKRG
jgi:tetratricopeptide (TPR) repeat protein